MIDPTPGFRRNKDHPQAATPCGPSFTEREITMTNFKTIAATLALLGTTAIVGCDNKDAPATETPGDANAATPEKAEGSCGGEKAEASCAGEKAEGSCGGEKAEGSCGGEKAEGSCGGEKAEGSCGAK